LETTTITIQDKKLTNFYNKDTKLRNTIKSFTYFSIDNIDYVLLRNIHKDESDPLFIHASHGTCQFCKNSKDDFFCSIEDYFKDEDIVNVIINMANKKWMKDIAETKEALNFEVIKHYPKEDKYHFLIKFPYVGKMIEVVLNISNNEQILLHEINGDFPSEVQQYIENNLAAILKDEYKLHFSIN